MTSDLVLHQKTRSHIDHTIKNLPHALIVTGPRGIGTTAVAQLIASSISRTVRVITPKKRSGTKLVEDSENGAILIEDIRNLYEQTHSKFTTPQVFIIDFADRTMTHGAQNAFLKLLEEPQPNIYFILATHHPESLLPTVLSRCQRIDLLPISSSQTVELLDTLQVTDPTKRARIQFIASGLPAEIHHLVNDETYYEQRVTTVQDAKSILGGSAYAKLLIVRKYKDQRPLAMQLIDDMLLQLRRSLERTQDKRVINQINNLVSAYDKIQANGNIQLQLSRVLL